MQGLRDAVDAVLNGPVGPQDNGPLGNLTSAQVAGALIPDIVTIDFSKPVVFPNGRQLSDDVIDVALKLVLNRNAGVTDAINANDKSFSGTYPYFADAFVAAPTAGALPQTGGQPGDSMTSSDSLLLIAMLAAGAMLIVSGGSLVLARRGNNN